MGKRRTTRGRRAATRTAHGHRGRTAAAEPTAGGSTSSRKSGGRAGHRFEVPVFLGIWLLAVVLYQSPREYDFLHSKLYPTFAGLAVVLAAMARRRRRMDIRRFRTPLDVWIAGLLVFGVLSAWLSPEPMLSLPSLGVGVAAAFAYRLSASTMCRSSPESFIAGLTTICTIVAGIALAQALGIPIIGTGAASLREVALQGLREEYVTYATLGHKNLVGSFLTMGAMLALGLVFGGASASTRRWSLLSLMLIGLALGVSHARTSQAVGLVLSIAGLLFLGAWPALKATGSAEKRHAWAMGIVVGIGIVLGVALYVGGPSLSAEIRRRLSLDDPWNAFNHRGMHWIVAWTMARSHPLLGVGPGQFGRAYSAHALEVLSHVEDPFRGITHSNQAHCDPLQILAELGWPGFLMALGLVAQLVRLGIRFVLTASGAPRALGTGLLLSIAAFHATGLLDFPLSSPPHVLLYAMAAGTLVGISMPGTKAPERAALPADPQGIHSRSAGILSLLCIVLAGALLVRTWRMREADRAFVAGRAAYQHGAIDRAQPLLSKAVRLDTTLAHAHYYLGRIAHRQKRFDEAEFQLKRADALWPYAPVDVALGYLAMDAGHPREAVEALTRFVTFRPMSAPQFYHLLRSARQQAGLAPDAHIDRMADPSWRIRMAEEVLKEGKALEAYHWYLSLGNDSGRFHAVLAALQASDPRRANAVLAEIKNETLRRKAETTIRRWRKRAYREDEGTKR